MQVTLKGFPRPAKLEDLNPGELFLWRGDLTPWLCMKVETADGQSLGFLAFSGPEHAGDNWPIFLDDDAINDHVALLPDMDLVIEPLGGADHVAAMLADSPGHGSLVVDAEGRAWVCHGKLGQRAYYRLEDGQLGRPVGPTVGFKNWELCLRDGKVRIELASLGS